MAPPSESFRNFPCVGEDGGGSRAPVIQTDGRVELPVTEFGVHRPGEFLGRDDFAVLWKVREDTMDCYFHGAWAERKRRLQRGSDIAQRAHPSAFREARGESVVDAFK